jgi:hypothetical protein
LTAEGIAVSLLLALVLLAGATLRTTSKLFDLRVPWRASAPGVGIALLLAFATSFARHALGSRGGTVGPLLLLAPAVVVFLLALTMIGSPWLTFFIQLGFRWRNIEPTEPSSEAPSPMLSLPSGYGESS